MRRCLYWILIVGPTRVLQATHPPSLARMAHEVVHFCRWKQRYLWLVFSCGITNPINILLLDGKTQILHYKGDKSKQTNKHNKEPNKHKQITHVCDHYYASQFPLLFRIHSLVSSTGQNCTSLNGAYRS